jgi:ubiquinone/menaquinone biosynthesis C-methylase UbiE
MHFEGLDKCSWFVTPTLSDVARNWRGEARKMTDHDLSTYENPNTVMAYAVSEQLAAPEPHVFGKYVRSGASILDLGVGGGRTTRHLAFDAGRYVGVDYAAPMVEICRRKYPALEFHCLDARDLTLFPDRSFDVVLFSFNGLDTLPKESDRLVCLKEMRRVARETGYVIFSSHNAKWIISRPNLTGADPARKIWRTALAAARSLNIAVRHLEKGGQMFYHGRGYSYDPVHGGLWIYSATPEIVATQLEEAGLKLVETISPSYPKTMSTFLVPWYYYVATPK